MILQNKLHTMSKQEKFLNDNMGFLNLITYTIITITVTNDSVFINIGQNMDNITFEELYECSEIIHDYFDNDESIIIEEFDSTKEMMYYTLIDKTF